MWKFLFFVLLSFMLVSAVLQSKERKEQEPIYLKQFEILQ